VPEKEAMKHPPKVTVLLVALFVVAQLVGLWLINESIIEVEIVDGQATLAHTSTAIGDRPDFVGWQSFLYLVFGVALGTALLLLLIRFRKVRLWKAWFLLAVFLAQAVAFGVVLPHIAALLLALALSLLKVYKPNPWVHNITEIFMYAGIAVLLVPILDVFWSLVLLLIISLYDAWAVWRSRHMVKMAEFQKDSNVFAGLFVPKSGKMPKKAKTGKAAKKQLRDLPEPPGQASHAILGGGDIAFPLLFTGAVMEGLILAGIPKLTAYMQSLFITLGATIALAILFVIAKKDRYYPAMPFLTAGCLLGWLALWIGTIVL
jgi:presenilin-like A22 family membrane protease